MKFKKQSYEENYLDLWRTHRSIVVVSRQLNWTVKLKLHHTRAHNRELLIFGSFWNHFNKFHQSENPPMDFFFWFLRMKMNKIERGQKGNSNDATNNATCTTVLMLNVGCLDADRCHFPSLLPPLLVLGSLVTPRYHIEWLYTDRKNPP